MLITPRPNPPYYLDYPEADRDRVQSEYLEAERKWQRESDITMWMNMAFPILTILSMIALAFGWYFVGIPAIEILAR